jgi:hypothetical protein
LHVDADARHSLRRGVSAGHERWQDYPRRATRVDFDLMALPGQQRPGDRARAATMTVS